MLKVEVGARVRVTAEGLFLGEVGNVVPEKQPGFDCKVRLDGWRNLYPFDEDELEIVEEMPNGR